MSSVSPRHLRLYSGTHNSGLLRPVHLCSRVRLLRYRPSVTCKGYLPSGTKTMWQVSRHTLRLPNVTKSCALQVVLWRREHHPCRRSVPCRHFQWP